MQNGKFWHFSANYEKMWLDTAKIATMPQVYTHNGSFEPNLTITVEPRFSHSSILVGPDPHELPLERE